MRLLVRADASPAIGVGHVMRTLALAQVWQDAGGEAVFALASCPPALATRLQSEGMGLAIVEATPGSAGDAAAAIDAARRAGAACVAIDGYHFGTAYQAALRDAGLRVLAIDDNAEAGEYVADLVLNQNVHAGEPLYARRAPHTRLLLGTRYALLRREFTRHAGRQRPQSESLRRVLVTLGGSDPANVTPRALRALEQTRIPGLQVRAIAGGSNPRRGELERIARESSLDVCVQANVADMAEAMTWADVAVSAAGSTCWEMALLGLPALLVVVAENQAGLAEGMDRAGAAVNLGWHDRFTEDDLAQRFRALASEPARWRSLAERGRSLVDGGGARRVVAALRGEGQ